MELTGGQGEAVVAWAAGGATLNEIQKRLKEEFGVTLTYLETRFVVSDLGITLVDPRKGEAGDVVEGGLGLGVGDGGEGVGSAGGVRVATDSIAVPGTLVSGTVTFGDGKRAKWYLDQFGRLGLDPDEAGYRPVEADFVAFQRELESVLRRQGF